MVKGCERRVVVYKSNKSKYFYEAHFILKEGVKLHSETKRDILEEANRIIRESTGQKRKEKQKNRERVIRGVFFLSGILSFFVVYCVLRRLGAI